MGSLNIKKLIKKEHVLIVLNELAKELNVSFFIKDKNGEILYGEEDIKLKKKYPLIIEEETVGILFGDEKCSIVSSMIKYIINNEYEKRNLINETLDKYKELSLLYEVSEKITSCLDLSDISNLAIDEASKLIDSTNALVMLVNRDSKRLEVAISNNSSRDTSKITVFETMIFKSVIDKGTGEIINDLSKDPRTEKSKSNIKSMICSPLRVKDRNLGVLVLANIEQKEYKSEDLKFLNTIATQTAVAIENAFLYGSMKDTFFETLQALIEIIEKRDPFTAGHAKRVAKFSVAIAQELGLSPGELTKVKLTALLHDIGKIVIEDSILLKTERLTNEEYEIIKKHPEYGAEIISNIKQLKDIVAFVRSHHEKYDGSGYPDGLKDENIPLISRILAVADSFDAMTSNRAYRSELDKDCALNELSKNVYSQFDPIVVKAFMKVYKVVTSDIG